MRSMLPRALRWFALAGLLSVLGAWAFPSATRACSCTRQSVTEALEKAAVVFEGTTLASYEGWSRQQVLRVEKVYKGRDRLGQLAGVTVLGKGSSCAMKLQHGQRYIVYGQARGHALTVSMCSRTKLISSAEEDLRMLEPAEFRRNFDLQPTPDRDWLEVSLSPDWALPDGRLQKLEISVKPTATMPRVPIAAVLALDLSVTGTQRARVVEVARATIDALPNGAYLSIVGLSAPNVEVLGSTAIDERSRADMHAKIDALPTGKPAVLGPSGWLAAARVGDAPFEAAARLMVIASAGGAEDEKLSAEERDKRLANAAERIRYHNVDVSVFSVDDAAGKKNLGILTDASKGRFHSDSEDVEAAIAADVARMQRVVGGLATLELTTHGGADIVGARGLHMRRSRRLAHVLIGNLVEGESTTRTLFLDIPDSFEVDDPLVSVRLRYLDPSGTSAQAFETVDLGWNGPP